MAGAWRPVDEIVERELLFQDSFIFMSGDCFRLLVFTRACSNLILIMDVLAAMKSNGYIMRVKHWLLNVNVNNALNDRPSCDRQRIVCKLNNDAATLESSNL